MSSTYGRILRIPGAAAFSAAGLLARFPMSMTGISTILAVQSLYGSYSAAGAVSAANVVATAAGAPMLAKLVDEHGQSRVMLPALLISGTCLLGLIVAAGRQADLWLLVVLAALAGGLSGSMGSLVRSRWTAVVSRPEDVHTAFSLEAAFDEVAFIVGPVLATGLCTSSALPVTSGWLATLALQVGGGAWFLSQRGSEPVPHARRHAGSADAGAPAGPSRPPTGPAEPGGSAGRAPGTGRHAGGGRSQHPQRPVLRHGAVLAVLVSFLFSGALFGANDVAAVAFATEAGRTSASGLVLAAWSIGSLTAALVYGSRSWRWPLWKHFLASTTGLAVGVSLLPFAPGLLALGALMAAAGTTIAPTVTTGNNIVQATVAPAQLTEGLAWISTALNVGVSLGSMAGGRAVDDAGSHGGYLVVAVCGWLSVAAALAGLRALRQAHAHPGPPR